jgi:hypothetical protein
MYGSHSSSERITAPIRKSVKIAQSVGKKRSENEDTEQTDDAVGTESTPFRFRAGCPLEPTLYQIGRDQKRDSLATSATNRI